MAVAVAMPLVRRRLGVPAPVALASTAAAPFALAIARPRTKGRDAGIFFFQMWAFLIAHEIPYDDPERLRRRLRIDYPIRIDGALGLGQPPTLRLQGLRLRKRSRRRPSLRPGARRVDVFLTWVHWLWFLEPYCALVWILVRHNERFPTAAARMAAVFDIGAACYAAVPTAPPWWASEEAGRMDGRVRRLMVEVGERFWGRAWPRMYDFLGGNPWAAMPSLHFATSVMAAVILSEAGPLEGAVGWAYAATLGLALVYLGEHYLADVLGGAALVVAVRRGEPLAAAVLRRLSPELQRLERLAA